MLNPSSFSIFSINMLIFSKIYGILPYMPGKYTSIFSGIYQSTTPVFRAEIYHFIDNIDISIF